jgi:glyoxylase I family protein
MMPAAAFHHIALNCHDPGALERFYSDHFGFRRARVVDLGESRIVFLKSPLVYLELFAAGPAAGPPAPEKDGPSYPGIRHLAFKVDDVDAKLAAMGDDARITLGPMSFDDFIPGWRSAWLADPEGNIVEISQGFIDQENPPSA